jgi:hypothetical protein
MTSGCTCRPCAKSDAWGPKTRVTATWGLTSYGDIIGHKVGDYTHRLIGSETVEGTECFMVESLPVSERVRRDGGYGKRISWIRKDNFVSSKLEGYDLQGRLFKRLLVTDIRLVDPALGR